MQVQDNEVFPPAIKDALLDVLSRFKSTEIPTPSNIKRHIVSVARRHFITKQLGMLYTLQSGVPIIYHRFLSRFSVPESCELYKALNATPKSVLDAIDEPLLVNASQRSCVSLFEDLHTWV